MCATVRPSPNSRSGSGVAEIAIVPLTNGGFAICDKADFALVSRYKWRRIRRFQREYAATERPQWMQMHRLILGLDDPLQWVDHKNVYGLDNRRSNIRRDCARSLGGETQFRFGNG